MTAPTSPPAPGGGDVADAAGTEDITSSAGPPQRAGRGRPGRRVRRMVLVAAAVVAVLLGLGAVGAWTGASSPAERRQRLDTGPRSGPAPEFSLPGVDGAAAVSLADLRGRPAVVNFWASWCVPCRREMPRLAAAARRLGGRVRFVGVDTKDTRAEAARFARRTGVPYRSGFDPAGQVAARYGVYGLPTTVFVDARGRIVGRWLGELSQDRLDDFLDQLVSAGG